MKRSIALISLFSLFLFSLCSNEIKDTEELEKEIINSDLAMSALAVKEGFFKAILFYADDDIVKLNEGNHPVIGKKDFNELYKDNAGPKTLTWEPVKAEVAQSGELGYSWGNWKFEQKDTTYYGNYFTVWKLKDGKWKVALDGGNSTPPPK